MKNPFCKNCNKKALDILGPIKRKKHFEDFNKTTKNQK